MKNYRLRWSVDPENSHRGPSSIIDCHDCFVSNRQSFVICAFAAVCAAHPTATKFFENTVMGNNLPCNYIGKTHESYTYSPAHATVHYRGRQTEPVASDSAGSNVK